MTPIYRITAAVMTAAVAMPLAAQPPSSSAMSPAAQAPKVIDAAGGSDLTTLTAKIEAVDHEKRTVTLKGPMGRTETLKVDPSVKNFAQVKAGDDIVIKYAEAVSVKLEKGPVSRSASVATAGPITATAGGEARFGGRAARRSSSRRWWISILSVKRCCSKVPTTATPKSRSKTRWCSIMSRWATTCR